MKVILFRRPDGGCSVVRPAPELFNPNSRTIRAMESAGIIFPSVRKILEQDQAKGKDIEARYLSQLTELKSKSENIGVDLLGTKAEALENKRVALVVSYNTEIEAFKFHCQAVSAKRENHPDFVLSDFVEEAWTYLIAKSVPLGAEWRYAESDTEFPDRYYRDAWHADDTGNVVIDMEKAREIHRDHIRHARGQVLQELDIQYLRADEVENKELKASIAKKKQALRDATKDPAIDKAGTPEQLMAIWPEGLAR